MKSCVALLSGGLDSVTSTAIAKNTFKVALALTFDYGQRAAKKEIEASEYFCKLWGIPHKVVVLPWLKEITGSAIVDINRNIKSPDVRELWVPNRNGIFINIAASFAEAFSLDVIVTGFNLEEGREFPDNSKEFVKSANEALKYSTLAKCSVMSFIQEMDKREILEKALELNVPIERLWVCYEGGQKFCGACLSCRNAAAAIQSANKWGEFGRLFNSFR